MIEATLPAAPRRAVTPSVALIHWPAGEAERRRLAAAGVPRLLLVEADVPPPTDWGVDEDWVRLPSEVGDIERRTRELCRRTGARPTGH